MSAPPLNCLNCGSVLQGAFCGKCGQRAIAAYPTTGEMIGDAWRELSGYDGRFMRTFRLLLGQPGALTIDTLEGRRARYISPVRLYLVSSLVYFLCAASVPNIREPKTLIMPGSKSTVVIDGSARSLPSEERERLLQDLERAPWWAQAIIRPVLIDPGRFQRRMLETLPRVLFALVPVFAGIVALFYRRRRFTQHLIFAIHLHAAIFIMLAVRELSQLTRSRAVLGIFEVAAAIAVIIYGLLAFRTVYRESWPRVSMKAVGIAALYVVAGVSGLIVTILWTAVAG